MRYPKLDREKIKELHNKGLSDTAISKLFKCHLSTISKIRKNELKLPPNFVRKHINREKIREYYNKGLSDNKIAEKLNCSNTTVFLIRKKELELSAHTLYDQSFRRYPSGKKLYSEYKLKGLNYGEIAEKYSMPLYNVQLKIGKHLMFLCRIDEQCPFKALLPETKEKKQ